MGKSEKKKLVIVLIGEDGSDLELKEMIIIMMIIVNDNFLKCAVFFYQIAFIRLEIIVFVDFDVQR